MQRSSFTIGAIFILGCVAGGAASQLVVRPARAQAGVPRWEYNCGVNAKVAQLNEAGAQGWELVTATAITQRGEVTLSDVAYCFKRPLP